jgi:hypothetical protein
MSKKETIIAQGTEVALLSHRKDDYISLIDMAKFKNAEIPATVYIASVEYQFFNQLYGFVGTYE